MKCQLVLMDGLCLLRGLRSGLVHLNRWIKGRSAKGGGCRGYYTVSAMAKG